MPEGDDMSVRPALRLPRTAREAEQLVLDWMRYLGFADASLTSNGSDGGVDVRGRDAVAQVKAEVKPVRALPLQAIYGIGHLEQKMPLFFALDYSQGALVWAEQARLACFGFDLSGELVARTTAAEQLLARASGDAAESCIPSYRGLVPGRPEVRLYPLLRHAKSRPSRPHPALPWPYHACKPILWTSQAKLSSVLERHPLVQTAAEISREDWLRGDAGLTLYGLGRDGRLAWRFRMGVTDYRASPAFYKDEKWESCWELAVDSDRPLDGFRLVEDRAIQRQARGRWLLRHESSLSGVGFIWQASAQTRSATLRDGLVALTACEPSIPSEIREQPILIERDLTASQTITW
jgi:hypothetical protein